MASNELIDDIISEEAFKQVEKMQSEMRALMDTFIDAGITVDTLNKALSMQTGMENTTKGINSNKQALSELEKVKAKIITTQEKSNALNTIYGLELERQKQRLAEVNTELQRQEQLRKSEEDSLTALKVKLGFLKEQWSLMGKAAQDANQSMLKEIQQTNVAIREQEKAMSGRVAAVKVAKVALTEQELLINKITKATSQEGQDVALLRVQLAELNKINKQVAQSSSMIDGSIEHMSFTLNRMREQFTKLSPELRNSPFGIELNRRIQATDTELKKLDAGMGVYKRNVGNYSNATFQLSQSLRELPAFAFSAQTGILALSNNLPMLVDSFNQVKASTGSAGSALAVFAKSVFTFTNLFTIALGLFTVFYKEIVQFVIGTKELNKEFVELNKSIATNGAELKILTNIINNHNISKDKQLKAAQRLKEIYPVTLKNYSDEAIVAGKASKEIDKLGQSIVALARIKAIEAKVTEYSTSMLNNEISIRKASNDLLKLEIEAEMHLKRRDASGTSSNRYDIENQLYIQATDAISRKKKYIKEAQEANKGFAQGIEDLATMAANELPKIVTEHEQMANKELDISKKSRKDKVKEYEGYISDINHLDREYQLYSEKSDQEAIDRVHKRQDEILKLNKEYQKMELDLIRDGITEIERMWEEQDRDEQMRREKALSATDAYINSSLQAMSIASQTFTDRQNASFDKREKEMNSYYDNELHRINQTTMSAKKKEEEIAKAKAQREAQQKIIDKERAIADRKAAIRQKAIDIQQTIGNTILGITGALSRFKTDGYLAIANAVAIGIAGTAQTARLIATPLPEYAKGTEHSEEGYAVVGEKGTELVTDPSGKSWLTPAKDTITYLKKGSKVTTNEKLMEMVKNSAYVQLANMNTPVTSDLYTKTLIEKFEENTNELKALKGIMQDKAMSVQIQGNYDHYIHVRNNIR